MSIVSISSLPVYLISVTSKPFRKSLILVPYSSVFSGLRFLLSSGVIAWIIRVAPQVKKHLARWLQI